MKKFNIAILILIGSFVSTKAQFVALYRNATRCIFLKSDSNLIIDVERYNNLGHDEVNLKAIAGIAIDKNYSTNQTGEKYLNLTPMLVLSPTWQVQYPLGNEAVAISSQYAQKVLLPHY